jgi:hypothetical protein
VLRSALSRPKALFRLRDHSPEETLEIIAIKGTGLEPCPRPGHTGTSSLITTVGILEAMIVIAI